MYLIIYYIIKILFAIKYYNVVALKNLEIKLNKKSTN